MNDVKLVIINIYGDSHKNFLWKCLAYVDDLLVACHASEVDHIFALFARFFKATGSLLNRSKTEILASVSTADRYVESLSEYWKDRIRFLGFEFSIDQFTDMASYNWSIVFERAREKIEGYKLGRLTIPGKIVLLHTAVFPVFYYWASTFLPPGEVVESLARLTFELIWSPAKRKIVDKAFSFCPKTKGAGVWFICCLRRKVCFFLRTFYAVFQRILSAAESLFLSTFFLCDAGIFSDCV
jgi:hypothetical protein